MGKLFPDKSGQVVTPALTSRKAGSSVVFANVRINK